MRTLIIILILANLGFAAWALLIDRPRDAPAAHDISHLPKLMLAHTNTDHAAPRNSGTGGAMGGTTPVHCVTVGPFNDLTGAAEAASLLQTRGFSPAQRAEPGTDLVVYWVYLDNVASDAAANRLLQKLHNSGLADARVMPAATATEPRRLSLGLFNEHDGAERRARQVRSLGLAPAITEQHQSQATYWVNINLTSPGQSVSTEGLLPPATADAHLEIRDCPASSSSAPAPAGALPQ